MVADVNRAGAYDDGAGVSAFLWRISQSAECFVDFDAELFLHVPDRIAMGVMGV